MAKRDGYVNKARRIMAGQEIAHETEEHGPRHETANAGVSLPDQHREIGAEPLNRAGGYETNELNERRSTEPQPAPRDALAMARWRAMLAKKLRHWDDAHLQALAAWNIVMAFDRADAAGFRRHLVPSLAALSDEDLAALIDWPTLATLEESLWRSDPTAAGHVSRGAQRLAAWWNARRAGHGTNTIVDMTPDQPDDQQSRFPGG